LLPAISAGCCCCCCRLCAYETLLPIIEPIFPKARCAALFLGPGLSTFPELVYDR
jgi:hypothetical protein